MRYFAALLGLVSLATTALAAESREIRLVDHQLSPTIVSRTSPVHTSTISVATEARFPGFTSKLYAISQVDLVDTGGEIVQKLRQVDQIKGSAVPGDEFILTLYDTAWDVAGSSFADGYYTAQFGQIFFKLDTKDTDYSDLAEPILSNLVSAARLLSVDLEGTKLTIKKKKNGATAVEVSFHPRVGDLEAALQDAVHASVDAAEAALAVRNAGSYVATVKGQLTDVFVGQIEIDSVAPVFTFVAPSAGVYYNAGAIYTEITYDSDTVASSINLVVDSAGTHSEQLQSVLSVGTQSASGYLDAAIWAYDQGQIGLSITGADAAGNVGSAQLPFVYDSVAPSVELVSPDNDHAQGVEQATLRFSVADNIQLAGFATVLLDGEAFVETVTQNGDIVFSADLNEGLHTWQVEIEDLAGNSAVSESRQLIVDLTPPEVYLVQPEEGVVVTDDVFDVVVAHMDALTLVDTIQAVLQIHTPFGSIVTEATSDFAFHETYSTAHIGKQDFDYSIEMTFTATDSVGNAAVSDFVVEIDQNGPIIHLLNAYDGMMLSAEQSTYQIQGLIIDGHLSQASVNGLPLTVAEGGGFFADVPLVPGPNDIEILALDGFGRETILLFRMYRGSGLPNPGKPVVFSSDPVDGEFVHASSFGLTFHHYSPITIQTAGLYVAGSTLQGGFNANLTNQLYVTQNTAYTQLDDFSDGYYTFTYFAIDLDGNVSDHFVVHVLIDANAPRIVFSNILDGDTVSDEELVVIGRAYDIGVSSVRIDGDPVSFDPVFGTFEYVWSLQNAVNILDIVAIDNFGQQSHRELTVQRDGDGRIPTIWVDPAFTPNGRYTEKYPAPLTFYFSDADGINLDSIELYYGPKDPIPLPAYSPYQFPLPMLSYYKDFIRTAGENANPPLDEAEIQGLIRNALKYVMSSNELTASVFVPNDIEGEFTAGIYVEDNLGNGASKWVTWETDIFPPIVDILPWDGAYVVETGTPQILVRAYDPSLRQIPFIRATGRRGPDAEGTPLPYYGFQVELNGQDISYSFTEIGNGIYESTVIPGIGSHTIKVRIDDGFHTVEKQHDFSVVGLADIEQVFSGNLVDSKQEAAASYLHWLNNRHLFGEFATASVDSVHSLVLAVLAGEDQHFLPLLYETVFSKANIGDDLFRSRALNRLVSLNGLRSDPRLDDELYQLYVTGSTMLQGSFLLGAKIRPPSNPIDTHLPSNWHVLVSYIRETQPGDGLSNPKDVTQFSDYQDEIDDINGEVGNQASLSTAFGFSIAPIQQLGFASDQDMLVRWQEQVKDLILPAEDTTIHPAENVFERAVSEYIVTNGDAIKALGLKARESKGENQ